jgi:hypothetical protein
MGQALIELEVDVTLTLDGGGWSHTPEFGIMSSPGGIVDHDCNMGTPPVPFPPTTPNFFPGILWGGCAGCAAEAAGAPGKIVLQHNATAKGANGSHGVVAIHSGPQKCSVICKNGASDAMAAANAAACNTDCVNFCAMQVPPDEVKACFFKDINVKGNCDVLCKDGRTDHEVLVNPTQQDCHDYCDTFCGLPGPPDNNAVQSCFFKNENVKGNCEVECKDGSSEHFSLFKPTTESCVKACATFCGANEAISECRFKDQVVVPTVTAWGVAVMVVMLIAAGGVVIHRRRRASAIGELRV